MARTLEQILTTEKPEVVAKARLKADKMLLDSHLAELREQGKTSGDITDAIGINPSSKSPPD